MRRARSAVSTSLPPSFQHSLTHPLPSSPEAVFGFRTLFGLSIWMQNTVWIETTVGFQIYLYCLDSLVPVSYTHLTLPTICSV
eukprot:3417243-Rhodomonas_salina.1